MALAPTGRLALDFQASRAAVQAPDLKEYRYLHFATHGLLNDVRPELSGLVLSLVDRVVVVDSGRVVADGPTEVVLKRLAENNPQAANRASAAA